MAKFYYCFMVLSVLGVASDAAVIFPEGGQPEPLCSKNKWSSYKQQFGKRYTNSIDDSTRFSIFCKRFQDILKHNANPNATYEMAVNHFTDMSSEELVSLATNRFLGDTSLPLDDIGESKMNDSLIDFVADPPDSVDWSNDPTIVSPARHQGFCGSCWTFAIVGMLEGQQRPKNGEKLIESSEQNILDCNESGFGCGGGFLVLGLEDVKKMGGLMSRADYPYVPAWNTRHRTCKINASRIISTTKNLGKVEQLRFGDETKLKQVVASYGPVAIGIHASENFHSYSKGIFYEDDCPKQLNHAMLLVGYGTDASGQDYWKVKNSWGGSSWNPFNKWGQKGFGLIARNRKNVCGIGYHSVIINK